MDDTQNNVTGSPIAVGMAQSILPGSGWIVATVTIVKAHDVVLAEVVPALHFDHQQRSGARIFEAVTRSDRNESRLVDAHGVDAIAIGDAGLRR